MLNIKNYAKIENGVKISIPRNNYNVVEKIIGYSVWLLK